MSHKQNLVQKVFSFFTMFSLLLQNIAPAVMLLPLKAYAMTSTPEVQPSVKFDYSIQDHMFSLGIYDAKKISYALKYETKQEIPGGAEVKELDTPTLSYERKIEAGSCSANDETKDCVLYDVTEGALVVDAIYGNEQYFSKTIEFKVVDGIFWQWSNDISSVTKVEKGVSYQSPWDSGVVVTFTKLPEQSGSVHLRKVALTKEEQEKFGSVVEYGYDITSDMKDGTFEYSLTFPMAKEVVQGDKPLEVLYAESKDEALNAAKTAETVKVDADSVVVDAMDHFTFFVVAWIDRDTIDATCDGTVYSVNNNRGFYRFDSSTGTLVSLATLTRGSSASAKDPYTSRTYFVDRTESSNMLFYYDHATSTVTDVGQTGISNSAFTKLDFQSSGALYGMTDNGNLYSINLTTGAATLVRNLAGVGTGGDMVFVRLPDASEDTLYIIGATGRLTSTTISSSVAPVVVSEDVGLNNVRGMAYSNGQFVVSADAVSGSGSNLYTMNIDGSGLSGAVASNQPISNDLSACQVEVGPRTTADSVTVCKQDTHQQPLAGWRMVLRSETPVETISIPVNGTSVSSSTTYDAGNYVLVASGRYRYGNSQMLADASNSYRLANVSCPPASGHDDWVNGETSTCGFNNYLSINQDLSTPLDPAGWGQYYNPESRYAQSFSGGRQLQFKIWDACSVGGSEGCYGDNTSTPGWNMPQVDVYAGYAGDTGADGCVTFENVPYGNYTLEEIMQNGWEYVSGPDGAAAGNGTVVNIDAASESFLFTNRNTSEPTIDPTVVTGVKYSDENSNGVRDDGEVGLENWTIVAAVPFESLDAQAYQPVGGVQNGPIATTSQVLENGEQYLVRVSGTYDPNDALTADAMYSVRAPNTEWTDLVQHYESYGPTLLDLQTAMDGSTFTSPSWGTYNSAHTYWTLVTGTGSNMSFRINDIYPWNNSGSLHIDMFRVIASTQTAADGSYSFNLPDMEQDIIIAEVMQDGYVQTAPTPNGYCSVEAESTATCDFGNHEVEVVEPTYEITVCKEDVQANRMNGWEITLATASAAVGSSQTSGNGCTTFSDLHAGTYTLTETAQADWFRAEDAANDTVPTDGVITVGENQPTTYTFVNEQRPVTIVASKIVCDAESDLPNWGAGGHSIGASTAADYVANSNGRCHLAEGWQFEYGPINAGYPADGDTHVGPMGGSYVTAPGVTGADGSVTFQIANVSEMNGRIETREVLQQDYLGFGGVNTTNSYSAEFYCTNDGLHYDNWEWINNPQYNSTYYCVALNTLKPGSIEGYKFNDVNGNGVDDAEPRVGGVTVTATQTDGPMVATVTTDSETGAFDFEQLTAGTYRVCETAPEGWTQTYPSNGACHDVTVEVDQTVTGMNFGNFQHATITGSKYSDRDADGVRDAGESAYAGWNFNLEQNVEGSWVVVDTTVSAADGSWSFVVTQAGTYRVREENRAGWLPTTYPTYSTDAFDISSGVQVGPFDFGNTELGSIQGLKFNDINGNGTFDGSEQTNTNRLNNWAVSLYDSSWNRIDRMQTGVANSNENPDHASGSVARAQYRFTNLVTGTYFVCEEDREDWMQTRPTSASGVINGSGDNTVAERCFQIRLNAGQDRTGVQFGNFNLGQVHGMKWNDTDSDGVLDDEESPATGWVVFVDTNENGVLDTEEQSVVTDTSGTYNFQDLTAGTYSICEQMQEGWMQTYPGSASAPLCHTVTIQSGSDITGLDFGNFEYGEAHGSKWEDVNEDGMWNEGERVLGGWTIFVDENENGVLDTEEQSTVTAEDGSYAFSGLTYGNYQVCEVMQRGWHQTSPVDEASAPVCHQIFVQSGSNFTGLDFGNFEYGEILGMKWNDLDEDGEHDESDPAIADWTIFIDADGDSILDAEEASTSTDVNGAYAFTELNAGTYRVCEVVESGWAQMFPGEATAPECYTADIQSGSSVVDRDFGNTLVNPNLQTMKFNDATGDKAPGSSVVYTIEVTASESAVLDATVTDLPPAGFRYRTGSWTAVSNLRGDLKSAGITTEPTYASPGTWQLGDMRQDEVVTLTYVADISGEQQYGVYPDLAWAQGQDLLGGSVVANEDDGTFVGTRVSVVREVQSTADVNVKSEEKVKEERKVDSNGMVLGASTLLPATGANTAVTVFAGILLAVGAGLIGFAMKAKKFGKKAVAVAAVSVASFILFTATASHASAQIAALSIRLQEPKTPSYQQDLRLSFVSLDIQGRPVEVRCMKRAPGDADFVQYGSTKTVTAGGNSDYCQVNNAVVNTEGTYAFRVDATAGEDIAQSNVVSYDYRRSGPGTPSNYSKSKTSDCEYKISFRSADDSGKTVKVEVYHSTETSFAADPGHRIATVTIGSATDGSATVGVPECSKNHYFVIRAYDAAGNGSGIIGDKEVTTIREYTDIVVAGTTTQQGALPAAAGTSVSNNPVEGDVEVAAEETEQQQAGENAEGQTLGEQTNEDGKVLGTETTSFKENLTNVLKSMVSPTGLLAIAAIVILVVGIAYVASRKTTRE